VIRSLPLIVGLILALPAAAAEPATAPPAPAEPPKEDTTLERYRTPLDAMMERMIGEASRAVRVDWRRRKVGFGVLGGRLLELNNFSSARLGGFVRRPLGNIMGELAINRVFTWGSESTRKLALTPYRQLGRPSRFELDANIAYPLAEGVATARSRFFPATELVFSANAGLRYLYYHGSLSGAGFRGTAAGLIKPQLARRELDNLEARRKPGMQVDGARYNLLTGLSLDVYFRSGGFVTPRVMAALPLTGSGMEWWWDVSLALGWLL
jgi:hypothetical protein